MDKLKLEYPTKLRDLVEKHGKEKLRFHVPMREVHPTPFAGLGFTSSDDPMVEQVCVIDESDGEYVLDLNNDYWYKVKVRSLDAKYGWHTFYVSDLESLLRSPNSTVFYSIAA